MIHMALSVIATTYLDKAKQWEPVHIQRRSEALQHTKTGQHWGNTVPDMMELLKLLLDKDQDRVNIEFNEMLVFLYCLICLGYQNQLEYLKNDGSFAAGSDLQSSTW